MSSYESVLWRERGRRGEVERERNGSREGGRERQSQKLVSKRIVCHPPSNFLLSDYPWGEGLWGFTLNFEFCNYYFSPLINRVFPDLLQP